MSQRHLLDYPGELYYVQLKSHGHRELFNRREDYPALVALLPDFVEQQQTDILAYCCLRETLHFVMRAGPQGIKAASRALAAQISHWHNELHQHGGSVFNSFLPITLIESKHYLLPVVRQLHQLPVNCGLVAEPSIYPWSSHSHYTAELNDRRVMEQTQSPSPIADTQIAEPPVINWLERETLLNRISSRRSKRHYHYRQFMRFPQEHLDWLDGNQQDFYALASDRYIEALQRPQQPESRPDLASLAEWVCKDYGLNSRDLLLHRRHRLANEVRAAIAYITQDIPRLPLAEIADYLEQDAQQLETHMQALLSRRKPQLDQLRSKIQYKLEKFQLDAPSTQAPTIIEEDDLAEPALALASGD